MSRLREKNHLSREDCDGCRSTGWVIHDTQDGYECKACSERPK